MSFIEPFADEVRPAGFGTSSKGSVQDAGQERAESPEPRAGLDHRGGASLSFGIVRFSASNISCTILGTRAPLT